MVTLTQPDGSTKQYKAKLTGVDPDKDLAVLKIDAPKSDLRKLPVGDSIKTKVGQVSSCSPTHRSWNCAAVHASSTDAKVRWQFSFAIGNPFGQDHTLTSGVISGMNREITSPTGRKIKGVIQVALSLSLPMSRSLVLTLSHPLST
jgi:S1-C subfamily serine protease